MTFDRPVRTLLTTFTLSVTLGFFSPILAEPVPAGGEILINTETLDDQDTATVAVAPDGSFMVVWESYDQDDSQNGVFLRRFDASGTALTGDQQVNTNTAFEQEDPDIARLADGSFVVVWDSAGAQDGSYRGIFGRLIDSAGSPVGGEFLVNEVTLGHQNDAVVAPASDGGFMVAWETQKVGSGLEDLAARRFDSNGAPVGGEFAVNQFTTGDQEDVDIASDSAGNFVVVWESEGQDGSYDSIIARLFDPTGAPVGDEFVVNSDFFVGNQDDPDLAVYDDGRFVVVWEDDTQDSFVDAVYARYFDASGNPTSDGFKVDADPGRQMNPRVAFDRQGQAVVIWDSLNQDAPGIGVFLNSFNPSGVATGTEQQVNTTAVCDQLIPHLAVAENGQGVAVWESGGCQDGSGFGVYARIYEIHIFADGFESGNTTAWSTVVP